MNNEHKFWSTQPVKQSEDFENEGPIESLNIDSIQKEPLKLNQDYEFYTVDITNENELQSLYQLLSLHYVEDDDCTFRFDYSAEFLKWALQVPGWNKEFNVGVRVKSNKKIVGFISAVPAQLLVRSRYY
jgi:glycylpeptide N-tetradecanoyltransferase